MFCVKCGSKLPDDAAFCPKCGTEQVKEAAPAKQTSAKTPVESGKASSSKTAQTGIEGGRTAMDDYVRPRFKLYWLIPAALILLLALFITVRNKTLGGGIILFWVFGLICVAFGIIPRLKFNRIKKLDAQGQLDAAIVDFQNSQGLFGNQIRLGKRYIFTRHRGQIIPCSEVSKVFCVVHRAAYGLVEQMRQLRVSTKGGKYYTLCLLATRGKDDDAVQEFVNLLHEVNNQVTIDETVGGKR